MVVKKKVDPKKLRPIIAAAWCCACTTAQRTHEGEWGEPERGMARGLRYFTSLSWSGLRREAIWRCTRENLHTTEQYVLLFRGPRIVWLRSESVHGERELFSGQPQLTRPVVLVALARSRWTHVVELCQALQGEGTAPFDQVHQVNADNGNGGRERKIDRGYEETAPCIYVLKEGLELLRLRFFNLTTQGSKELDFYYKYNGIAFWRSAALGTEKREGTRHACESNEHI